MVDYALDDAKTHSPTEKRLFESSINLGSTESAYMEMAATKQRHKKPSKILAYHIIQSFKPGEVSAEQAHDIGVEFAQRCFGERFEAVVGTHLDKSHYHNHIVVNSVSFADGMKLRSNKGSYYREIRGISDALCREYSLSVITPQGHGKPYKQWLDEKAGKPNWHSLMKADIDECIVASISFKTFVEQLKARGYEVRCGPNITHMAVKPKGAGKRFRLDSLKDPWYTEAAIKERIAALREGREPDLPEQTAKLPTAEKTATGSAHIQTPKRYRPKRPLRSYTPSRKLSGFTALYWKYCYLLHTTSSRKLPKRAAFLLRSEVYKFDRYQRQFMFLHQNRIVTAGQLQAHHQKLERQIEAKVQQRRPLYRIRRDADDPTALTTQINGLSAEIKTLRRTLRLCEGIEENARHVYDTCKRVDDALETNREKNEERADHENREKDPAGRYARR